MTEEARKLADELKPCPFCGLGQSMVDPWFDDVSKRWAIGCGRCGASSGRSVHAKGSKEAAIRSWNTRPSHEAGTQEPVAWQPGRSIESRARDLLEIELNKTPEEPTIAALRAIEAALQGEATVIDALRAVWDDWITANDESGMDEYEIKDVSLETRQQVHKALTGRLYAAPASQDATRDQPPTLGSSIDLLIGLSFNRVETLNPDAKHKYYRECGCCGGTDESRDHYKPDIGKVEHKADCPLARDLPILRAIGLASDVHFRALAAPARADRAVTADEREKCSTCKGRGYVVEDGDWEPRAIQCPDCVVPPPKRAK